MHIDVIHNIEQYDQLVEIFHDMQLMHMFQKLLDFFHPIYLFIYLFYIKLNQSILQNNEVQLYLMKIQLNKN